MNKWIKTPSESHLNVWNWFPQSLQTLCTQTCRSGSGSVNFKTLHLTPIVWHLSRLFSTHIKWTHNQYQMFLKEYYALARHNDFPVHLRGASRGMQTHLSLSEWLKCVKNQPVSYVVSLGAAWASQDETRLVKTLFTGYNKVVRPVNHFKDPVVVTVGLQLIQLISVVRSHVTVDVVPATFRLAANNCLNTFIWFHRMRSTRLSTATCGWNRFAPRVPSCCIKRKS